MKKGQAALEFLMTYGWAIIVVLIMIGALAYFGVVNPTKYLPDKCLMSTGIGCTDFQVLNNGGNLQLKLSVANKEGVGITIQSFNATVINGGVTYTNQSCGVVMPTPSIDVDQSQAFTCTFLSGSSPGVGQSAKINVIMNYIPSNGNYNHTINGQIQATIQ